MWFNNNEKAAAEDATATIAYLKKLGLKGKEIDELLKNVDYLADFSSESISDVLSKLPERF